MFLSVNSTLRITLWRILPGLLLAAAFACRSAAQAPEAPAVPPGKAVSIAVSRNMPVAGETVTVQRLAPEATTCEITDPQGGTQTLVAKVRRVAPESPGIAIYNAFSVQDRVTIQPALDAACSQAVEDFPGGVKLPS